MRPTAEKHTRETCPDEFIAPVTLEARQVGHTAAARNHNIPEDTARTWLNHWPKISTGTCSRLRFAALFVYLVRSIHPAQG